MDFSKEDLIDLIYGGGPDYLKVMSDKMIDKGRWEIHHQLVFEHIETGKFYLIPYTTGATEYQEQELFEGEGDLIFCTEVRPVEVTKIKYVPVTK